MKRRDPIRAGSDWINATIEKERPAKIASFEASLIRARVEGNQEKIEYCEKKLLNLRKEVSE